MRRYLLILLLALPLGLRAQENTFSVDADYLTRGEIRKGGLSVSEDGDALTSRFILGRTRLGASYSRSWLSARLTAQHAGTWGSPEGSNLSMNEAWVRMQSPKGFFAQLGRQRLSYDDQRIFGADDWSMTGISHDGLKAGLEIGGHKLHLFGAYNQDVMNMAMGGTRFSGGVQPYKSLGALWYHYDVPKANLGASVLFLNMGMQADSGVEGDDGTYFQQLAGVFVSWKPKHWGMDAAYYRQRGKEQMGIPLNAWMASVKGTATPSEKWSMRAGYDYLSGEENFAMPGAGQIGLTRHEVVRGFSSLYGSNHKFYGAMDFFYVSTYVNGFTPGLQNLYAGITWKPGKLSLDASYHYFSTAAPIEDSLRALGQEVELTAEWTISKEISLSAGYSYMLGTETMERLKRIADNNRLSWAWMMLQITPKFFSSKW